MSHKNEAHANEANAAERHPYPECRHAVTVCEEAWTATTWAYLRRQRWSVDACTTYLMVVMGVALYTASSPSPRKAAQVAEALKEMDTPAFAAYLAQKLSQP